MPPVAIMPMKPSKLLTLINFLASRRLHYEKNIPPLMSTLAPVMKLDAGEAR